MLAAFRNALDYPLRQYFRWRRRGLQFRNEAKDHLFARLPAEARPLAQATADRLLKTYNLQRLFYHSRVENYCENLFYLELLESALQRARATLPPAVNAADIGASKWFYVPVLFELLHWWQPVAGERLPEAGRAVTLSGFEADAYRVYTDFYSRYDHAQAHVRDLENAHYVPRPFERQPGALQFVTQFFPFIFLPDYLKWGLPRPMFASGQLLADVWASVASGGLLVIVNQGETLGVVESDGTLWPLRTDAQLNARLHAARPALRRIRYTLRSGDFLPFLQRGLRATSLQTSGSARAELGYHTVLDTLEVIEPAALEMTAQTTIRVVLEMRD